MALHCTVIGPTFDGQVLHFTVNWSEDNEQIFSDSFIIPGWIARDGTPVLEDEHFDAALERSEATATAYLNAKRNPPAMPPEYAEVMRRPMTRAELMQQLQQARAAQRAPAPGLGRVEEVN